MDDYPSRPAVPFSDGRVQRAIDFNAIHNKPTVNMTARHGFLRPRLG
ncbi:hypothetical protein M2281_005588 [Mesorhizobium soli]|nr:hypothetical protein [Mesorhizobium soli]